MVDKAKDEVKAGKEVTYELVFNGQTVTKVRTSANLNQVWADFVKANEKVSDKRSLFPTMFVGYLVQKHQAKQIDLKEKADTKFEVHL